MVFGLVMFFGMLAIIVGMPLVCIFIDAAIAWYDHWCARLEVAVERFCRARGWY